MNGKDTGKEISRRELLKMAMPFGTVEMAGTGCTGCGLCALDCPTEALFISSNEETETFQLLFKNYACISCRKCIDVCPEQCLRLERGLETDSIGSPAAVLFEDELCRCSECGSPIGPRPMINSVRAKLLAAGQPAPQLELCSECRMKAQFQHSLTGANIKLSVN